jgi:hypothetical protein
MVVFLICTVIYNLLLFQEHLTTEIIPGSVMPDTAFPGYSPAQSRAWYLKLKEDDREMVLLLGLLDVFGIIPSYVLGCGAQLVTAECPRVLLYLPLWTASFDLIESLTTLCAVASIQYGIGWAPSSFHLLVASAATQFKGVLLFACIGLVGWLSIRSGAKKKLS